MVESFWRCLGWRVSGPLCQAKDGDRRILRVSPFLELTSHTMQHSQEYCESGYQVKDGTHYTSLAHKSTQRCATHSCKSRMWLGTGRPLIDATPSQCIFRGARPTRRATKPGILKQLRQAWGELGGARLALQGGCHILPGRGSRVECGR